MGRSTPGLGGFATVRFRARNGNKRTPAVMKHLPLSLRQVLSQPPSASWHSFAESYHSRSTSDAATLRLF
jgi:hypothetical protein